MSLSNLGNLGMSLSINSSIHHQNPSQVPLHSDVTSYDIHPDSYANNSKNIASCVHMFICLCILAETLGDI